MSGKFVLKIEHFVGLFNYNIGINEQLMSNKTEKITIRITKELKDSLVDLSKLHNVSIGLLIRNYLEILTTISGKLG